MVGINPFITLAKQITSGDALSSFRISGNPTLIALRLERTEAQGLTGGQFTEMTPYVRVEIFNHIPFSAVSGLSAASGAVATLIDLVRDFKITIASGTWANSGSTQNVAPPVFMGEEWPMPTQQQAKAALLYRTKYLM